MPFLESQKSEYKVKLEDFEGPLDLLLTLIEHRKLFINDVSLSKIADEYISMVKALEKFPKEDAASFILIASTLVLLKSKSLLPELPLTSEEEENIEDLEERLRAHQEMKRLMGFVEGLYGKRHLYGQKMRKNEQIIFSPDEKTTVSGLAAAIQDLLKKIPLTKVFPEVAVKKILRLEDVMERMAKKMQNVLRMSFQQFHGARAEEASEKKAEIIVSFMALLELVKMGTIQAHQEGTDIMMEAQDLSVPMYGQL